jgi:hypothetical protein
MVAGLSKHLKHPRLEVTCFQYFYSAHTLYVKPLPFKTGYITSRFAFCFIDQISKYFETVVGISTSSNPEKYYHLGFFSSENKFVGTNEWVNAT